MDLSLYKLMKVLQARPWSSLTFAVLTHISFLLVCINYHMRKDSIHSHCYTDKPILINRARRKQSTKSKSMLQRHRNLWPERPGHPRPKHLGGTFHNDTSALKTPAWQQQPCLDCMSSTRSEYVLHVPRTTFFRDSLYHFHSKDKTHPVSEWCRETIPCILLPLCCLTVLFFFSSVR